MLADIPKLASATCRGQVLRVNSHQVIAKAIHVARGLHQVFNTRSACPPVQQLQGHGYQTLITSTTATAFAAAPDGPMSARDAVARKAVVSLAPRVFHTRCRHTEADEDKYLACTRQRQRGVRV